MPCRESAIVGTMQAVARHDLVDDVQMLSLWAEQRRAGRDAAAPAPSAEEWNEHLDAIAMTADRMSVPESRRDRMHRVINEARPTLPDGPTFYAARHARRAASVADLAVSTHLEQVAARYGQDRADVQAAFKSLVRWNRGHRRDEQPPQPPEAPPYDTANVPADRGTRWALAMLHTYGPAAGQNAESMEAWNRTLAEDSVRLRCDSCGEFYGQAGHVCPSRAAEQSNAGEGRPTAHEPAAGQPVQSPRTRDGQVYLIPDTDEDPHTLRIGDPNQTPDGTRRYRGENGQMIAMMNRSALRDILNRNRGEAFHTHIETETVRGDIAITDTAAADQARPRIPGRYGVAAVTDEQAMLGRTPLQCTCPRYRETYHCEHVDGAVERVRQVLETGEIATAPPAALDQVAADINADEQAATRSTEAARSAFQVAEPAPSYSNDMDAFQSDWDEIRARFQANPNAGITFMTDNATGGLGSQVSGATFGLEIEVDFPDEDPYRRGTSRDALAAALHREGISRWNYQHGWHAMGRVNGRVRTLGEYTTDADTWHLSFDRSVDDVGGARGSEIISPILYDTPQTWQNLQRITDLVKEHGGQVNTRHGLHVNIGAAAFNHTIEKHRRLLRAGQVYEDVLIRTGTNPANGGSHRGRHYCRSVLGPSGGTANDSAEGFRTIERAATLNNHYQMINLRAVPSEGQPTRTDSRVEFRFFDGTLDAGRVQASTKVALAMMNAANRGAPLPTEAKPAGWHRQTFASNGRMRRLTGDRWETATESIRSFADTMYSRHEDKKQFLEMVYTTRWQNQ